MQFIDHLMSMYLGIIEAIPQKYTKWFQIMHSFNQVYIVVFTSDVSLVIYYSWYSLVSSLFPIYFLCSYTMIKPSSLTQHFAYVSPYNVNHIFKIGTVILGDNVFFLIQN